MFELQIRQFFFFLNLPRAINLLQTNITPPKIISLKNSSTPFKVGNPYSRRGYHNEQGKRREKSLIV